MTNFTTLNVLELSKEVATRVMGLKFNGSIDSIVIVMIVLPNPGCNIRWHQKRTAKAAP